MNTQSNGGLILKSLFSDSLKYNISTESDSLEVTKSTFVGCDFTLNSNILNSVSIVDSSQLNRNKALTDLNNNQFNNHSILTDLSKNGQMAKENGQNKEKSSNTDVNHDKIAESNAQNTSCSIPSGNSLLFEKNDSNESKNNAVAKNLSPEMFATIKNILDTLPNIDHTDTKIDNSSKIEAINKISLDLSDVCRQTNPKSSNTDSNQNIFENLKSKINNGDTEEKSDKQSKESNDADLRIIELNSVNENNSTNDLNTFSQEENIIFSVSMLNSNTNNDHNKCQNNYSSTFDFNQKTYKSTSVWDIFKQKPPLHLEHDFSPSISTWNELTKTPINLFQSSAGEQRCVSLMDIPTPKWTGPSFLSLEDLTESLNPIETLSNSGELVGNRRSDKVNCDRNQSDNSKKPNIEENKEKITDSTEKQKISANERERLSRFRSDINEKRHIYKPYGHDDRVYRNYDRRSTERSYYSKKEYERSSGYERNRSRERYESRHYDRYKSHYNDTRKPKDDRYSK